MRSKPGSVRRGFRNASRPWSTSSKAVRRTGRRAPLPPASIPAEGVTLEQVEHALLVKALAQARNNKSQAAKLLGLPRGQLYSLLRRHGLTEARR